MGEDESCKFCMDVGSLKHVLSGCKTSLTLSLFMTGTLEFILCESGRKVDTRHIKTVLANGTKHRIGDYWLMSESNFKFHSTVVTAMRPDLVLYSKCEHIVYFIQLTILFKDTIEEAFERKNLK